MKINLIINSSTYSEMSALKLLHLKPTNNIKKVAATIISVFFYIVAYV